MIPIHVLRRRRTNNWENDVSVLHDGGCELPYMGESTGDVERITSTTTHLECKLQNVDIVRLHLNVGDFESFVADGALGGAVVASHFVVGGVRSIDRITTTQIVLYSALLVSDSDRWRWLAREVLLLLIFTLHKGFPSLQDVLFLFHPTHMY